MDKEIQIISERVNLVKNEISNSSGQDEYQLEYPNLVEILKILFVQFDNQISQYKKYLEQEEKLRDDLSETGTFSIEYDNPDDPYNDRKQLVDRLKDTIEEIDSTFEKIKGISYGIDRPYFGSINYKVKSKIFDVYVGKHSIVDSNFKQLVSDWRSPIASAFYQSGAKKKNINIAGPLNNIEYEVLGKKYIDIVAGRILDIYEPMSGNKEADRYLQSKLKTKKAGKLEDIITSIQENQDEIIRSPKDKALIIQGVAGSGKTTILFHRISYLLYTYPKEFRAPSSCLIVPSKLFRSYTEDILLSLGLSGLLQLTFFEFVNKYLEVNFPYKLIKTGNSDESLLSEVDDLIAKNEKKIIFSKVKDKRDLLEKIYNKVSKYNISLSEKVSEVIDRLNGFSIDEKVLEVIVNTLKENIKAWNIYAVIFPTNQFNNDLSKYIEKKRAEKLLDDKKISGQYVDDIEEINQDREYPEISIDTLCSLVYINYLVNGSQGYSFDLLAVDEAQNLTKNQVKILSLFSKKNNVLLAGDINQQINGVINSWEELKGYLPECDIFVMDISYRLSSEISHYINSLADIDWPKLTSPISRPESLNVIDIKDPKELVTLIFNEISRDPSQNIALITTDLSSSESLSKFLVKVEPKIKKYLTNQVFESGISVLTVDQTKGLEFDTVFVIGFENIDKRRKYVAISRTLNKLFDIKNFRI